MVSWTLQISNTVSIEHLFGVKIKDTIERHCIRLVGYECRLPPKILTWRARSRPKLNRLSRVWTFWIENGLGYNTLKNNKNSWNSWREFKILLQQHEFFNVKFWIPANCFMYSCDFLICCSPGHFLSKKSKLGSNDWVLAENELSKWEFSATSKKRSREVWKFGSREVALWLSL